jgi:hypothetical protein
MWEAESLHVAVAQQRWKEVSQGKESRKYHVSVVELAGWPSHVTSEFSFMIPMMKGFFLQRDGRGAR